MSKQAPPRRQISSSRLTGRILEWKGTFGWIQPDAPISHPEASKKNGKIFLSQTDVEAEITGVGAHVSFFVYTDGSGLGAMNCRPHANMPVQRVLAKAPVAQTRSLPSGAAQFRPQPAANAASAATGARSRIGSQRLIGTVIQWRETFGWILPASPIAHPLYKGKLYIHQKDVQPGIKLKDGDQVSFVLYADQQGLGAEQCTAGSQQFLPKAHKPLVVAPALQPPKVMPRVSAGNVQAVVKPPRPGLRSRITSVATTGEVLEWKGQFGWLRAHEPVEHPEASKKSGKIYVAAKDLIGVKTLELGQLVQFHIFADGTGLGAEECAPF